MSRKRMIYSIEIVYEPFLGAMIFGAAGIPKQKLEKAMNNHAKNGYRFEFMAIESRRVLLFWQRDAAILTFAREIEVGEG